MTGSNPELTPPTVPTSLPPQPRCLSCGYVLSGLQEQRCPECGRPFDLRNPSTYSTKPPLLMWRFWMPGFTWALGGSIFSSYVLLSMGNWGWSLWFAVPFAAGALIGYRFRAYVLITALLIIGWVITMITTALIAQIAGIFCGMTLAALLVGPILIGTVTGAGLRTILKHTQFSQRWHLPALLMMAAPIVCAWIEGQPSQYLPEQISTSAIIAGSPDECWDSIIFYEDVTHQPPLILRIGLAHPLFTTGESKAIGDIKKCVYNKGYITKQVTEVRQGELLAFSVIEQSIGYENDVRLIGGRFEFQPVGADRTQVTLTTEYQPLLSPRWAWRWSENYAVHTLHNHVLKGMRLNIANDAPATDLPIGIAHVDHR